MTDAAAVETAWKIHSALGDWTGKVDSKASFALTIESALLAGVIALSGEHHRLSHLRHWWVLLPYWLGVAAIVAGAVLAALVVMPRLRRRRLGAEVPSNFIYFGHLRNWDPADLEEALMNRDPLPVLSRQLVNMSAIAWAKHRRVQQSMLTTGAGTALVAVAAALTG